ncbi:hypothetical protein J437_LFUL014181 [Ladona fulva]|uniref:Uncharacterized protein n=1 Tax=Ladona fulva TaxID=123851 RepID=A0A8K0KIR7_LADFU|nr:hypothetical protein J437_LFUL014181 [Ladona fulva]
MINKLVTKLKKMPSIRNIVPIPSAKVPIIKFKHIYTQLEGDISLYNTLAQHNTQLLKMYSCIDERVKLTDVQPKPEEIEEGQDVWFYKDREKLPQIWPEYGKNKLSVGSLWLKMLRFYTEDFDFEEYVISIRQKQKLFKFEKMWYKKAMAIEDPFDITHNLGGALSRKSKLLIIILM